jgi:hypothetical protein
MFEAALCGTWANQYSNPATVLTDAEVTGATSIESSGGNLPILAEGDTVSVSGFTESANAVTRAVVLTSTDSILILDGVALVNEAPGDTVTVTCLNKRLSPGTVRRSFSVLRHFSDQSGGAKPFHVYTGVEFNTLTVNVGVDTPVEVSLGAVGRDIKLYLSITDPTYGSETSGNMFVGLSGGLTLDGVTLGIVTEVSFTIENGLTPKFTLFDDKTARPSIGQCNVTGQLVVFFENAAMLERFYNEGDAELEFYLADQAMNRYTFRFPRVKINGGQPDSQSGPIVLTMPFHAVYDTANGDSAIRITRN